MTDQNPTSKDSNPGDSVDAAVRPWQPIEDAPRDGTEITLMIRHPNWLMAHAHDKQDQWQQEVIGKWIDHNGGGWTWKGMAGKPVYFRPNAEITNPSPQKP